MKTTTKNKFMYDKDEYNQEFKLIKKFTFWFIGVTLLLASIGWLFTTMNRTVSNGIVRYEEYYEINQTCKKINTDLCNMKDLPESDKMFEQFSKTQRINTMKTQLNRWIEEYNAKSKMVNRSLWKSSELPYQLNTNEFNCY